MVKHSNLLFTANSLIFSLTFNINFDKFWTTSLCLLMFLKTAAESTCSRLAFCPRLFPHETSLHLWTNVKGLMQSPRNFEDHTL